MKEKYSKFIVVGGGIAGSIAAYVCSRLKKNVVWFSPKNENFHGAIQIPPNSIEFLKNLGCFDNLKKILNPIWHVHNGKPPTEKIIMPFSMLLNLVGTSNSSSKELLWKFVKKYKKNINEKQHPIFDKLIGYAINYFNEVVKLNKKFRKPNKEEKVILNILIEKLKMCDEKMNPEEIQTIIYSVGKENGYSKNLREWFKTIYEIIFGDENGPRLGFFISFFGIQETIKLIEEKIK